MKTFKIKNTVIILTVLSIFTGCSDLSEINVNPNQAVETHPRLLLTQIEWDAFRDFGGTSPLYAAKMIVQTDGESSYQFYKWDRSNFDAYSRMRNVNKMMNEAERIKNNAYIALGKFFRAYYFFNLTITFGDIPYSEALLGETEKKYTPAYDSQKDVFTGILKELTEADDLLQLDDNIIQGDIIYGGSVEQWRKLVNSFHLKVLITLSKKDAEMNVKQKFADIFNSKPLMNSTGDNGQLVFLNQEGNRYPLFNESSFGSGMYIDSTFIRMLQDKQDPRLFVFCTQTKNAKESGKSIDDFTSYEGGDPAAPYGDVNKKATRGDLSKVLERYHQDPTNEPKMFTSYSELELIIAEATVRGWIPGNVTDVQTHYNNGVKASFKFYETYAKNLGQYVNENEANTYLSLPHNDLSAAATDEDKIEMIITQKYLQTFFQYGWTAFYEHLRTGYPDFRRPANVAIPYRWIYPQAEYNYNSDNVAKAIAEQFGEGNDNINQKTWWLQ